MKAYTMTIKGQVLNYFDAYETDHLKLFDQAQRLRQLCLIAGPTGYGKTAFLHFACASTI